jgi:hypothetical protein
MDDDQFKWTLKATVCVCVCVLCFLSVNIKLYGPGGYAAEQSGR